MLYFIRESMDLEFDHILGIFDNEADLIEAFKRVVEQNIKYAPNYVTLSITSTSVTNDLDHAEPQIVSIDDTTFKFAEFVDGFDLEFDSLDDLRLISFRTDEIYKGYLPEELDNILDR